MFRQTVVSCFLISYYRPNHEPLFELPSDEELDISVDDICAFPEVKGISASEATPSKGRISSFSSSHGSASSVSEAEEATAVDVERDAMTIPEETEEDMKVVTDQVSAVDINDKSLNSEGILYGFNSVI